LDSVALTEALLAFDTSNPPGQERLCALYVADILRRGGLEVTVDEFAAGRANVIACLPGLESDNPLVLTGHLDTVPVGASPWATNPIEAVTRDGRIYGRGASDMKSGVAAIVAAALEVAASRTTRHGLAVILTAGEEVGCAGARSLVARGLHPPRASALLVAEPTSNQPAIGHKGALYMNARTRGVTAHSSMPELGVNAIYKAARAIAKIESYAFSEKHPLLGAPTINVGMVSGGMNVNSVPDSAAFTIDVRSVPGQTHRDVLKQLSEYLGSEVDLDPFVDMPSVATDPANDFVRLVLEVITEIEGKPTATRVLPFFTDASVFQPALGCPTVGCPTVIFGPGEPSMAHQTDEFCYIDKIKKAADAIVQIACSWDRRTAG
jgi:succinyl-diaminopimelate desuccinylase